MNCVISDLRGLGIIEGDWMAPEAAIKNLYQKFGQVYLN